MTDQSDERDAIVVALIAERKRQGLSQRAVGRVLGTSSATMSQWERGENMPTLGHLRAWASVLGYDLALVTSPETGDA